MPAQTVIKLRRDTDANWTSTNPTLATGEAGFESDTGKLKIGDGSTAWTSLGYVSGGASVEVSDTPPSAPEANTLWWESDTGTLFIYYDNYWVEAVTGVVGPSGQDGADNIVTSATAPANTDVLWIDTSEAGDAVLPLAGTTGQVLVKASNSDYDTEWSDIAISDVTNLQSELNNRAVSHNYIINGAMDVAQRGTSISVGSTGYGLDRWVYATNSTPTSATISQTAFTPADLNVVGFGDAKNFQRITMTTLGSMTVMTLGTQLEDVQTLAGQTVTLSFWAKADSARSLSAGIIRQNFGSGGSANVNTGVSTASLTTSWQRFTSTVTLPSISGKTVGAGSHLLIRYNLPVAAGAVIDIWGVQLEAGSVATPFKRNAPSLQGELAACQRYFVAYGSVANGARLSTGLIASSTVAVFQFPMTLRTTPTVSVSDLAHWTISSSAGTTAVTGLSTVLDFQGVVSLNLLSSGMSANNAAQIRQEGTVGKMFFSAEL